MDFREKLEPEAGMLSMVPSERYLLSIAISTKRLADMVEKMDFTAPQNTYGEGLVEGIQNAIVRGQRGISTYER